MRINKLLNLSIIFLIAFLFIPLGLIADEFVKPTIEYDISEDLNGDRINDILDEKIDSNPESDELIQITLTLWNPVSKSQLMAFAQMGGFVRYVYNYCSYGFSGKIPLNKIRDLAYNLGGELVIIDPVLPTKYNLDQSARQIQVRQSVWDQNIKGNANVRIAVLDTGIDDSHTDLSGKVIAWNDLSSSAEGSAVDYNGHGTHVSGTIVGTGAVYGSGSVSTITTTDSGQLPATDTYGWFDRIWIPVTGTLSMNMYWTTGSGAEAGMAAKYPPDNWAQYVNSTSSPITRTYPAAVTGIWRPFSANHSGAGGRNYATTANYPYSSVGDGYNLFTGVAPECKLVGCKIFTNSGSGTNVEMEAAMDWIIANKSTYKIKVASMSANLLNGATLTSLRNKANSVVDNGIVFCISAGNEFPTYTIADPGLASKVITVGAVNDSNEMTDYSSNGPTSSGKPDVCAPGGSISSGREITAPDSNDSDAQSTSFGDIISNDYANMHGTSMATPHVSGLAALMISKRHLYTTVYPLEIKALILMTSVETNTPGEASSGNDPTLNRSGSDLVEGYGRVCGDAALDAITKNHEIGEVNRYTLSSGSLDPKVWARNINLFSGSSYRFNLSVPGGCDYDLYLYSKNYTSDGIPHLYIVSSNTTPGTAETIDYTASYSGIFYICVKRVSGSSGSFIFHSEYNQSPSIAIDYGSYGLYKYVSGTHTRLNTVNPEAVMSAYLDTDGRGELLVDYGATYGLYKCEYDGTHTRLSSLSPNKWAKGNLDISNAKDDPTEEIVLDFGAGKGLWVYDDGSWTQVNSIPAEDFVCGNFDGDSYGRKLIMIDYGPSYGLYTYAYPYPYSHTKINSLSPEKMVVGNLDTDNSDEAVIDFGSTYGLWIYNDGTYTKIHTMSPEDYVCADLDSDGVDEIVIDFGAPYGLWEYNAGSWSRINTVNPSQLAVGDTNGDGYEDLVISYPGYGLYNYDGQTGVHTKISPLIPITVIVCHDFAGSDPADNIIVGFAAPKGFWRYESGSWYKINDITPENHTAVQYFN